MLLVYILFNGQFLRRYLDSKDRTYLAEYHSQTQEKVLLKGSDSNYTLVGPRPEMEHLKQLGKAYGWLCE